MCAAGEQRHHSHRRHEIQVLLEGVEEAHKADIRTYCSGHLSTRWLSQKPKSRKVKECIWLSAAGSHDRCVLLPQRAQIEARVEYKKNDLYDDTISTTKVTTQSPRSEAGKKSPRQFVDPTELFLIKPGTTCQSEPAVTGQASERYWFTRSHMAGLTRKDQLRMKQEFARSVLKTEDLKQRKCLNWSKAAEQYERRLEKGLKKLSIESQPSRERLRLFSDVFDDICSGSQVLGNILREIKMEYHMYLNSVLDYQTGLQNMSSTAQGTCSEVLGAEDLEKAWTEVCKLEREVRKALEENDQVRLELRKERDCRTEEKELQNEAVSPGPKTVSLIDRVQHKRHQVWKILEEVQLLEKVIREEMVSTITTSAIEECIKESEAEIMTLSAAREHLCEANKNLESSISNLLSSAETSKEEKTEFWEKIWHTLNHEDKRIFNQ